MESKFKRRIPQLGEPHAWPFVVGLAVLWALLVLLVDVAWPHEQFVCHTVGTCAEDAVAQWLADHPRPFVLVDVESPVPWTIAWIGGALVILALDGRLMRQSNRQ